MNFENFVFPVADGTVKSGWDQVLRTSTLIRDSPDRGEEQDKLPGESDVSSSTPRQDSSPYDGETNKWFLVHFREFYLPSSRWTQSQTVRVREKRHPNSTEHISTWPRGTSTSLDTMLEKNIDEYWNVAGDRELLDTRTGSTRFTISNEKPPHEKTWSGRRLTRKQTTSRPDSLWPEIWKDTSEVSKRREKQKWAIEKPKLDNTRKLRGYLLHWSSRWRIQGNYEKFA